MSVIIIIYSLPTIDLLIIFKIRPDKMSRCSSADPEKFVRGGPALTVDEGREDSNTTISGPSSAVSKTPFKSNTLNADFSGDLDQNF